MDIKKILAGSKFVIFMLILAVIVGILSYRDSKVDIKTIKKVDVKTSSDQEDIQTKIARHPLRRRRDSTWRCCCTGTSATRRPWQSSMRCSSRARSPRTSC